MLSPAAEKEKSDACAARGHVVSESCPREGARYSCKYTYPGGTTSLLVSYTEKDEDAVREVCTAGGEGVFLVYQLCRDRPMEPVDGLHFARRGRIAPVDGVVFAGRGSVKPVDGVEFGGAGARGGPSMGLIDGWRVRSSPWIGWNDRRGGALARRRG